MRIDQGKGRTTSPGAVLLRAFAGSPSLKLTAGGFAAGLRVAGDLPAPLFQTLRAALGTDLKFTRVPLREGPILGCLRLNSPDRTPR